MSEIDQIKQALSIVDVVGKYVELKKAGINYAARCPFHNEKTPSFYVSPERNTFKCFGCGEGGDIFTFIEKIEGLEFKEVLEKFSLETGIVLSKNFSSGDSVRAATKNQYLAILQWATLFWQRQLMVSKESLDYLKKRGFTKKMLLDYSVGYAPDSWDALKTYLASKNISEKDMITTGLIKTGDKGKTYDRFRNRIVFPLRNVSGKTIAFSGRYMGTDDATAKYLNSPETPVFNKSKELYGLDTAKQSIRKNNFALVVEGQFDMVMSQQIFLNTVATSGTSLTRDHLQSIRRFTDRIIFVFDNDSAGINAAYKASFLALGMDFEVRIAQLPTGMDPADVINSNSNQYRDCIKHAKDVFDYWLHHIVSSQVSAREKNTMLEEKVFPLLFNHANALEQDRYINMIAGKMMITPESIRTRMQQKPGLKQKKSSEQPKDEIPTQAAKTNIALNRLALLCLWQRNLHDENRLVNIDAYIEKLDSKDRDAIESQVLVLNANPNIEDQFFGLEKMYENDIILHNDIVELERNLSTYQLLQQQGDLLRQHAQAIAEGREEDAKSILVQINNSLHNNASKKSN